MKHGKHVAIEVPDFTRGDRQKVQGYSHALAV